MRNQKEVKSKESVLIKIKKKIKFKLRETCLDREAVKKFKGYNKKSGKINVVFIVQYIPAWNKSEPVYNAMLNDTEHFNVHILCVPMGVHGNKLDNPDDMSNDIYDYFISHGYSNVINALINKNDWFDLKSINPDYVFYPRPYNVYMPIPYTTRNVSNYAKICTIMYGMDLTDDIMKITHNHDFFRDVYIYFAQSSYDYEYYKNNHKKLIDKKLKRVFHVGYPVFEDIIKRKNEQGDCWNFSKNKFRIIWTPRWTTDPLAGGTNFFTYKEYFRKKALNNKESIDFIFRPHPLAFENFVNNGDMTIDEVNEYKEFCKDCINVSLDESKEYISTIWNSDLLVTDISGMITEYMITGKPIIYCASNMKMKLQEVGKDITSACYIVNNETELDEIIEKLKNGIDSLSEERKRVLNKQFGTDLECIGDRIANVILEDNI